MSCVLAARFTIELRAVNDRSTSVDDPDVRHTNVAVIPPLTSLIVISQNSASTTFADPTSSRLQSTYEYLALDEVRPEGGNGTQFEGEMNMV